MNKNNAVFITVRLKSTRLKQKVLLEVNESAVLKYLVERIKANFDGIIALCTSTHPEDKPIEDFAKKEGIECFRGSEEDVLERYYEAANFYNAEKVYIIYGDEPFTDIKTMSENFDMLDASKPMWIKNDSLPEGTYGYGITFKGLEYLNTNKLQEDLEVWQLMASKMPLEKIEHQSELREAYENIRLTIDYKEDLEVFKRIIGKVGTNFKTISLNELVKLYVDENYYDINGFRINEYKARINEQGTIN